MRITCDADGGMGYIYLMPSKQHYNSCNNLDKYIEKDNMEIPVLFNNKLIERLKGLKLIHKTYRSAVYESFDINMEYCNDMDNEGYITGIELNLEKEMFIELISNKAFKIVQGRWRSKDVCVLTLDLIDKVFSTDNIIYPLSKKRDAFAIVYVDPKYNEGLIKGLITTRNSIYSIDYLKAPDFILT
ncbi:hypothetical protein EDC18_10411 [Natranaerovirga pectinivora]|uniref:Uncharacterized protein n=1 Tax=Natranaerovirga pectinivora TaxID=682400 RepID=A0A4R3ML88_9FIRM|nr:hypothetical protein [Natranaerovirga pectinivora]TCT14864.1 hypothetical protein EDC18_10411 [Natranaerovirga pectinivora]